jgi:predicted TIM-barrel fold metal-dependent hydrolase
MMRIDAHQHFWAVHRGDYGWLTPDLEPLYRDFLPDDLRPELARCDIDGTILVQAAPTLAETHYLLDLAAQNSFVKGVVGWVDFEASTAPADIARLAQNPLLVGLRPMIQDIADPEWMLRPGLEPAFTAIMQHDLTFDALTLPHHLPILLQLLQRHPGLRTVIDHGSKPAIKDGGFKPWSQDIKRLAEQTGAYCKISGLVTEAAFGWDVDDLKPYVDHLLECFGPSRLIWGSDWPVCILASSYEEWLAATEILLADLNAEEKSALMGGNASHAYHLRAQQD